MYQYMLFIHSFWMKCSKKVAKLAVLAECGRSSAEDCGGGGGTDNTAMALRSCRFNAGLSANAVPITFRSAHKLPVGMLTSMLVPRYSLNCGSPVPPLSCGFGSCTASIAKTGLRLLRNQKLRRSLDPCRIFTMSSRKAFISSTTCKTKGVQLSFS